MPGSTSRSGWDFVVLEPVTSEHLDQVLQSQVRAETASETGEFSRREAFRRGSLQVTSAELVRRKRKKEKNKKRRVAIGSDGNPENRPANRRNVERMASWGSGLLFPETTHGSTSCGTGF